MKPHLLSYFPKEIKFLNLALWNRPEKDNIPLESKWEMEKKSLIPTDIAADCIAF